MQDAFQPIPAVLRWLGGEDCYLMHKCSQAADFVHATGRNSSNVAAVLRKSAWREIISCIPEQIKYWNLSLSAFLVTSMQLQESDWIRFYLSFQHHLMPALPLSLRWPFTMFFFLQQVKYNSTACAWLVHFHFGLVWSLQTTTKL